MVREQIRKTSSARLASSQRSAAPAFDPMGPAGTLVERPGDARYEYLKRKHA